LLRTDSLTTAPKAAVLAEKMASGKPKVASNLR
jgi:hypothetical protein